MRIVFEGGPKDGECRIFADTHGDGKPFEPGFRLRLSCTDPDHIVRGCPDEWYEMTDRTAPTSLGEAIVLSYVGDDELPPESSLD